MGDSNNPNQKTWLAIVLVVLGSVFLLNNLDLIPNFIPYYLFGWEMIFVLVGGSMLVTGRREGFIFLLIGGFFLLDEIFYLPRFHVRDWWPLVLIIIGVSIFLRRRNQDHSTKYESGDSDFFEDTVVFGGSEKSCTSQDFKGGRVTTIFGGLDVDFTSTKMVQEEVVLDLFCVFGGSNFRVPNDWTIVNDSYVIFGGYSDLRSRSDIEMNDPNKILRIKGSVVFGGVEIKSA